MYSVFTKTITEPSAVDILRNYSNPNSPDFGDAQQIYADLCDHFEGGAIGQVTITCRYVCDVKMCKLEFMSYVTLLSFVVISYWDSSLELDCRSVNKWGYPCERR
eukprot:scaffold4230_cov91-Amphora_coffeaeformis.AAC.1